MDKPAGDQSAGAWRNNMTSQSELPLAVLGSTRLLPLVTIERVDDAVPLAQALVDGGLPMIEVALRTPAAPQAIRQILRHVPQAIPGAGNVLTAHDLAIASHSGARFAISPAASPALLDAAVHSTIPFIPGIATPSELMSVLTKGFHVVKFFPAMAFGGPEALRAMHAPFPHVRFLPTGGTGEAELDQWFALPNVAAVGGSWLAPIEEVRAGEWDKIRQRAAAVVSRLPH
jgi:2-dehydro-3-deoxyphosphogluconate aldolase/(4S)-4-hydroxy-2-oxoglutarate aldolase